MMMLSLSLAAISLASECTESLHIISSALLIPLYIDICGMGHLLSTGNKRWRRAGLLRLSQPGKETHGERGSYHNDPLHFCVSHDKQSNLGSCNSWPLKKTCFAVSTPRHDPSLEIHDLMSLLGLELIFCEMCYVPLGLWLLEFRRV